MGELGMVKLRQPPRSNDEIRRIILQYFYERNRQATSVRGKRGSAATISTIRAELKAQHGLSVQEVMSNLRYLISQGWVEETKVEKQVPLPTGTVVPQATSYYAITAAGIDKIEGPSEFTRNPFHGINIQATGQNIITVGDGNQVNAVFRDVGQALSELAEQIRQSTEFTEEQKLEYVADIQSMQAQLAKPQPNRSVLRSIWSGLQALATIQGVAGALERVSMVLGPLVR
jgi:hypothetical protein